MQERGGGTQERVCATESIMVFFYGYINSIATSFEYAHCRVQLQIYKKNNNKLKVKEGKPQDSVYVRSC